MGTTFIYLLISSRLLFPSLLFFFGLSHLHDDVLDLPDCHSPHQSNPSIGSHSEGKENLVEGGAGWLVHLVDQQWLFLCRMDFFSRLKFYNIKLWVILSHIKIFCICFVGACFIDSFEAQLNHFNVQRRNKTLNLICW